MSHLSLSFFFFFFRLRDAVVERGHKVVTTPPEQIIVTDPSALEETPETFHPLPKVQLSPVLPEEQYWDDDLVVSPERETQPELPLPDDANVWVEHAMAEGFVLLFCVVRFFFKCTQCNRSIPRAIP